VPGDGRTDDLAVGRDGRGGDEINQRAGSVRQRVEQVEQPATDEHHGENDPAKRRTQQCGREEQAGDGATDHEALHRMSSFTVEYGGATLPAEWSWVNAR
jgi:hypothetical protein